MTRLFNRLHASTNFMRQAVDFYVAKDSFGEGSSRFRAQLTEDGVLEREIMPGEAAAPSFSVDLDAVQQLFEELWAQGFRSKHDTGRSDRLDGCRKEHIEDLRKVAKIA